MQGSFADKADFDARGYVAGPWTEQVLNVQLAAASRWLRGQLSGLDERIESGLLDHELVVDVVCRMTARTVPSESLPLGMDSVQMTGGPYSESLRRTNPHGDFYLTKQERKTLGYGGQAFSINLLSDPDVARF